MNAHASPRRQAFSLLQADREHSPRNEAEDVVEERLNEREQIVRQDEPLGFPPSPGTSDASWRSTPAGTGKCDATLNRSIYPQFSRSSLIRCHRFGTRALNHPDTTAQLRTSIVSLLIV
jgi:hypothetical protein